MQPVLFLNGETNEIPINLCFEDNVQLTNQKKLQSFGKGLINFFSCNFLVTKNNCDKKFS